MFSLDHRLSYVWNPIAGFWISVECFLIFWLNSTWSIGFVGVDLYFVKLAWVPRKRREESTRLHPVLAYIPTLTSEVVFKFPS